MIFITKYLNILISFYFPSFSSIFLSKNLNKYPRDYFLKSLSITIHKSLRTLNENSRTYVKPSFARKMRLIITKIETSERQTPKLFAQTPITYYSLFFLDFSQFFQPRTRLHVLERVATRED